MTPRSFYALAMRLAGRLQVLGAARRAWALPRVVSQERTP